MSYVDIWMEKKIDLYRQTGDIPALIGTAKELFMREEGDLKYYRLHLMEVQRKHIRILVGNRFVLVFFPELANEYLINLTGVDICLYRKKIIENG